MRYHLKCWNTCTFLRLSVLEGIESVTLGYAHEKCHKQPSCVTNVKEKQRHAAGKSQCLSNSTCSPVLSPFVVYFSFRIYICYSLGFCLLESASFITVWFFFCFRFTAGLCFGFGSCLNNLTGGSFWSNLTTQNPLPRHLQQDKKYHTTADVGWSHEIGQVRRT